ncbi:TPA: hypothetical protein ACIBH9_004702 [Salmonella enterica subsp. diarizonae serovar 61:l,v:z35]|nr:hypothetical protein [Salmonella enterica]
MSYAHLFEKCDHVIEGNILLDIASIPPDLKGALICLIQSGLERDAFNAQLTEIIKHLGFDITAAELSAHLFTPGNA